MRQTQPAVIDPRCFSPSGSTVSQWPLAKVNLFFFWYALSSHWTSGPPARRARVGAGPQTPIGRAPRGNYQGSRLNVLPFPFLTTTTTTPGPLPSRASPSRPTPPNLRSLLSPTGFPENWVHPALVHSRVRPSLGVHPGSLCPVLPPIFRSLFFRSPVHRTRLEPGAKNTAPPSVVSHRQTTPAASRCDGSFYDRGTLSFACPDIE